MESVGYVVMAKNLPHTRFSGGMLVQHITMPVRGVCPFARKELANE